MPLLTCALAVGAALGNHAAAQTRSRAMSFGDVDAPVSVPRHPVRPPRAAKVIPPDFRALAATLPATVPAAQAEPDLIIVLDGGRRPRTGVLPAKDNKLQQAHDSIPDKLTHIAPNMRMLRIGNAKDGMHDLQAVENDVRQAVGGKDGPRPHGVLVVAMMNNAGTDAAGRPLLEINDKTNATATATFGAVAKGLRHSGVDNVNIVLFPSEGERYIPEAINAFPDIKSVRVLAYTDKDHRNRLQDIPKPGDPLTACSAKDMLLALTLAAGNLEFTTSNMAWKDTDGGIKNVSPVTAIADFADNPGDIIDNFPRFINETSGVLSPEKQIEIATEAHKMARQKFADKAAMETEINTSKPHVRLGCAVLGYIAKEAARDDDQTASRPHVKTSDLSRSVDENKTGVLASPANQAARTVQSGVFQP